MSLIAKMFIILCAVIFIFSIFRLLTRRKINEKNTLYWLGGLLLILLIAVLPGTLDKAAVLLGIDYPPALLFLLTNLILLYLVLKQAAQISELDDKVRELGQLVSLSDKCMPSVNKGNHHL